MIGHKLILLDEVDSTNNYTAKLLNEGQITHGTVILAEKQTAGRGQRGNSWSSGALNQFTCSVYAETAFLSGERYWFLNLAVALAVRSTIQAFLEEPVLIKWPNDVLAADKKMAGILIETQWRSGAIQGAVIGVGINLYPEPGLPSACALRDFTDKEIRPVLLAQEMALQLENQFQRMRQGLWNELLTDYHTYLWRKDVRTVAEKAGEQVEGYIRGLDGTGNLLFETAEGVRSFDLKEISFRY